MDTSPTSSSSTTPTRHPLAVTFQTLQIVLVVAVVVATLFTAWTPAGLLPGNIEGSVPLTLADEPTPTPEGAPTATVRTRPLIGIVVGHWDDTSKDPGATCPDGLTEFRVNQDIATLVEKDLTEKGFDVDLLKEFDPKLNGYQANALVSIHADSCDYINDEATGFKVAAALANPRPEKAARLTACLRNRYALATGLKLHNSITIDMSSYHAFDEINSETTAAIIEVGFLKLDQELLTQGQDKAARGITDGILCFLNNEDITPQATP